MKKHIYKPGVRKRKAYWTATVVLLSYLKLKIVSLLRGNSYYQATIDKVHEKNAKRINKRIQELEGLFIKIGQLISNLSNILPEAFREQLTGLQDSAPPKSFEEISATIKSEFGKNPEELFEHFDENPIAAASIGQVHKATLNGNSVVVKIRHANIETIAKADLVILKNLVRLWAFFMEMKGMEHSYEQVKQMIEEELDYGQEAISMQTIRENLEDQKHLCICIPEVYADYSTSKILTSQFCIGANISNSEQLDSWGLDQEDIAKRLIELFCKMALVDGFYHADPHPGNILVNSSGEIILLDYGAVARLSQATKAAVPELIESIVKDDTESTVKALKKMGFVSKGREAEEFAEKLINIFRRFLQDEVELDGLNFANIKLNSGFGSVASLLKEIDLKEVSKTIQIPKDWILLNRTIVLLMGTTFQLAPELNALHIVRPYLKKHLLGSEAGFSKLVLNAFKNQLTTAIALPQELHKTLKSANKGELRFEIDGVKEGFQKLYYLGQQFLFGMLAASTGYFWYVTKADHVDYFPEVLLTLSIFFIFLFFKAVWKGLD